MTLEAPEPISSGNASFCRLPSSHCLPALLRVWGEISRHTTATSSPLPGCLDPRLLPLPFPSSDSDSDSDCDTDSDSDSDSDPNPDPHPDPDSEQRSLPFGGDRTRAPLFLYGTLAPPHALQLPQLSFSTPARSPTRVDSNLAKLQVIATESEAIPSPVASSRLLIPAENSTRRGTGLDVFATQRAAPRCTALLCSALLCSARA
ncbi:hypothetical protein B2J93_2504 [Marssonina coronariae]|uniref:Uncharacterized protein n=1 Tax=Diplocarpon coronariae TaxID=2795749 RepID=A0A218ZGH7_9HELO|nr:hypothetical protein B2J93_2504 [Marssonina coronariae]